MRRPALRASKVARNLPTGMEDESGMMGDSAQAGEMMGDESEMGGMMEDSSAMGEGMEPDSAMAPDTTGTGNE
ncbi:MAG: hypothetical protein P8170_21940 [Gemmatimonadota bacterium]|jgi:hypothetical protein